MVFQICSYKNKILISSEHISDYIYIYKKFINYFFSSIIINEREKQSDK